jgi:hypothetical protein
MFHLQNHLPDIDEIFNIGWVTLKVQLWFIFIVLLTNIRMQRGIHNYYLYSFKCMCTVSKNI